MPRFLVMVKANEESEAGHMPTDDLIDEMMKYNEELQKAGVLLDLGGLQPTSKGARVRYSGKDRTVIDGPFTEAKELVAGYWLIEARSKDEAVEWAKRAPFQDGEVEIRQVASLEEFGEGPGVDRARRLEQERSKEQ